MGAVYGAPCRCRRRVRPGHRDRIRSSDSRRRPMSLLVKFNVILILCFGIALVPAHLITRDLLERNARTQVVQHARLMMQTALATRGYTNKQIKPLPAARLAEEFLPQTVPAYSATEIFNKLK